MMRSLYSGVAGLKTHQTKMDVIGNNIANTNTVGFKSSSVNFSDTFYQTISSASGANAETGTAGTNAKQIGLGSMVAAIQTNITEQGGPSTTNRALDVAINGEAFLVVRSGTETCFTKSGALNVDEEGNLYCTTNGATVQGWLADDDGNIVKDTVRDLVVMNAANQYYEPEATTAVTLSGNLDPNDEDLDATTGTGQILTFSFYDNIGDSYMVKMKIQAPADTSDTNTDVVEGSMLYYATIVDVCDSNSNSIFLNYNATTGLYEVNKSAAITFNGKDIDESNVSITNDMTGEFSLVTSATDDKNPVMVPLYFNTVTGDFQSIGTQPNTTTSDTASESVKFSIVGVSELNTNVGATGTDNLTSFPQIDTSGTDITGGIDIYFSGLTQYSQGGTSKINSAKGDPQNLHAGNTAGKMNGLSIDQEGKIWGNYDNGMKKCLAQMAVATFANPSGLESIGNSLFQATLNSGEFDGVGEEISLSGSFTVGALEMSNVDLANEFTQMITTQRGFQANSRIITVSDTMLEELVNLKR